MNHEYYKINIICHILNRFLELEVKCFTNSQFIYENVT